MAITCSVRMYRLKRLGDCFLLTFTSKEERKNQGTCRVLIDFGAFMYGEDVKGRLGEIATDIHNELLAEGDGAKLDAVVATHQHMDHVSGYAYYQDLFVNANQAGAGGVGVLPVGEVWMSWLDDPKDKLAKSVAKTRLKATRQLAEATALVGQLAQRIESNPDALRLDPDKLLGLHKRLQAIGRFDGFAEATLGAAGADGPKVPEEAYDSLKKMAGKDISYLKPGAVFDLPGLKEGEVKVYVLGPPRDETALKDLKPTREETYDPKLESLTFDIDTMLGALERNTEFLRIGQGGGAKSGTKNADSTSDFLKEDYFPFDEKELGKTRSEFESCDQAIASVYGSEPWRQIDNDWTNQLEQLALYLNTYTNNSSLVLAFELVKSGKILLFAADAQTGNWSSWQSITWKEDSITLEQLLSNVVLYKVGHHGSENATYKPYFEQMNHPDLVSLLPVDRANAKSQGWEMPAKHLNKALKEHSRNRVVRMDDGIPKLSKKEWPEGPPTVEELYIDITVSDD